MQNVIAETRVRTWIDGSVDKILLKMGLSDLFYDTCITDFYLKINEHSFNNIQFVLERMRNRISLIYDFGTPLYQTLAPKQHRDIEMIFKFPSWEPTALEHHQFGLGHHPRTLENCYLSNHRHDSPTKLKKFSRMWASDICWQEWEKATRFQYGYQIGGRWYRENVGG